jgi:hypothetical protein
VPAKLAELSVYNPPSTFTIREVVGMVPLNQSCPPETADWKGGAAFGSSVVPSSGGMGFCSYRWVGSGPPNPATLPPYLPGTTWRSVPASAAKQGATWLEPSDIGIAPSGLPAEPRNAVASTVRAQHAAAIGALATRPTATVPNGWFPVLPSWTKVYVLDNGGEHGAAVSGWVQNAACPSGSYCGVWVERRNVFDTDTTDSPASVLALARGIVDAANENVSGVRKVINISLGAHWTHAWNGNAQTSDDVVPAVLRNAYEALAAAINYAGCQGALVLAAAGNRDGGATDEAPGPLHFGGSASFPAALSKFGGGWTCTASPGNAPRQLIHPVGGIRFNGEDALSARPKGQSCFVAPSMGLTAEGDPAEGTSFATATVSGAAAAAWAYMPWASADQVMGTLYSQASVVGNDRDPRVCGTTLPYRQIRRLHACKAIQNALSQSCNNASYAYRTKACELVPQVSCSEIGVVSPVLSLSGSAPAALEECTQNPALAETPGYTQANSRPTAASCGPSAVYADPEHRNQSYSCPFDVLNNGQPTSPAVKTSPGDIGCGCSLYLSSTKSLWLVGSLLTSSMASPSVSVKLAQGSLYFAPNLGESEPLDRVYELGDDLGELPEGFAIKLAETLPSDAAITQASFSFTDEAGTRAHSGEIPVLVAPSN